MQESFKAYSTGKNLFIGSLIRYWHVSLLPPLMVHDVRLEEKKYCKELSKLDPLAARNKTNENSRLDLLMTSNGTCNTDYAPSTGFSKANLKEIGDRKGAELPAS